MKAIFAVTALAAAISGQALAADTETTTTFTGAMDARVIYDMAPTEATSAYDSTYDVDLGNDDFNYGITMGVAVTNGPFSGSVGIESDEAGGVTATVGDLIVTDGSLSFGQVGGLMSTDEYIDSSVTMADGNDIEDTIGFRYVAQGVAVQLGGFEDDGASTSVVASAQYSGAAGALAYVVEAQMAASAAGALANLDSPMFIGAGLTYSADIATVMAAFNQRSNSDGTSDSNYAVDATSTVAGATLSAGYSEPSSETTDDESIKVGVAYTVSAVSLSAGYLMTTLADAGDEVTAGLGYSAGLMAYSADVTLGEFDAATASDALIELNATYSAASGVSYYGDYAMQGDATNSVTLGAKYSF